MSVTLLQYKFVLHILLVQCAVIDRVHLFTCLPLLRASST